MEPAIIICSSKADYYYLLSTLNKLTKPVATLTAVVEVAEVEEVMLFNPESDNKDVTVDMELELSINPLDPVTNPVAKAFL